MKFAKGLVAALLTSTAASAQVEDASPDLGTDSLARAEQTSARPVRTRCTPALGEPVECRDPNAAEQAPAFSEQTRAPSMHTDVELQVETVAEGFKFPWAIAQLPDGRLLVTERAGEMHIVSGETLSPPIAGLPAVEVQEIAGLQDVVLDPAFASNRTIYWSYMEKRQNGNLMAVARGRLVDGPAPRVEDMEIIYRQQPDLKSEHGNSGRLLFDHTGALLVALGDLASTPLRPYIQQFDNSVGKIVRIDTDGQAAPGNPFEGRADAWPEVWALGFRNPLGLALRPGTDQLWSVDVGAFGGDELNLINAGANYGWPVISYGLEYSREQIGEGTQKVGMEQPVYYWDPVISPSSVMFYSGEMFPEWKDNAFVTSLSQSHLVRLVMEGDKVIGEERLLADRRERLRQVQQAPDGALYVLTDGSQGRLLRITPKREAGLRGLALSIVGTFHIASLLQNGRGATHAPFGRISNWPGMTKHRSGWPTA